MAISNSSPARAFTTRRATNDDIPSIIDVGRRIFDETFAHTMTVQDMIDYLDETYTTQHISDALQDAEQTVIVATTAAPQPVFAGFTILRRGSSEPCVDMYPNKIELLRLYVDNPFHGSGVAKLLTQACMDQAVNEGFSTIWLGVYEDNHKAKNFYQKFGFERVGAHDFVTGGTVTTDEIMVRPLAFKDQ